MSEFENYWNINCILVEMEQLKKAVRELEEKVEKLEKGVTNNDNEQRESVLRKVPKNA